MPIKNWSTTPASNNSAPPNGAPEGMAPSTVNDTIRQQMADHRSQWENAEWFDWGDTPSRASATSFKVTTDVTTRYLAGRRIKAFDTSTLYGVIASSSYSAPDTTVNVTLDTGSLSTSLSSIALGILSPTNRSMPTYNFDTITASGAAQFQSTVTASGAVVMKTTATVEGASTLSGATILKTTLNVEGASTLSGAVVFKTTMNADGANLGRKSTDIASGATTDLSTATGDFVDITGTTTITALGTATAGVERTVRFTGALTLTHHATSLILPGSTNITTASGDTAIFRSLGSGNWICISYKRATGLSINPSNNKNLIIGGNFTTNPWQRNTSFTGITANGYTADRFSWIVTGTGVVNVLKTADAPTVAQASIFTQNCFHVDITTADGSISAADHYAINYNVEGYDFAQIAQQTFTISFWVKATKTGTYCMAFINSAQDRSYVVEYTINATDTWEKKTITVTASPSAGTWNYTNGIGLGIYWTIAAGSTFHTTANAWQTGAFLSTANQVNGMDNTANNFKIALVQVEAGSIATAYEIRPIEKELALCQRYYTKTYNIDVVPGTNVGVDAPGGLQFRLDGLASTSQPIRMTFNFPVSMRAAPTCTAYAPDGTSGQWRDRAAGVNKAISGFNYAGTRAAMAEFPTNSSTSAWVEGHIVADSEL